MRFSRPVKKPLIMLLARRSVSFLLALCLLAVFLYIAGTKQNFTDRSQFLLLRISLVLGILLSIGSAFVIIINVFFNIIHKDGPGQLINNIILYIFLAILGSIIVALASFILVATGGNLGQ